jgi:hypothetical protein
VADSKSLSEYLTFFKQKDQVHFRDMSLSVLKLLGSGEYILENPVTAMKVILVWL